MASVVRIKRRQGQEPVEALLLAAKRERMDECLETVEVGVCAAQENVFRFCGTTKNEVPHFDVLYIKLYLMCFLCRKKIWRILQN